MIRCEKISKGGSPLRMQRVPVNLASYRGYQRITSAHAESTLLNLEHRPII